MLRTQFPKTFKFELGVQGYLALQIQTNCDLSYLSYLSYFDCFLIKVNQLITKITVQTFSLNNPKNLV